VAQAGPVVETTATDEHQEPVTVATQEIFAVDPVRGVMVAFGQPVEFHTALPETIANVPAHPVGKATVVED